MNRRFLLESLLKKPRLPAEFQEVKYLESTGTQYIDTNLVAATTMDFELKMWQSTYAKSKIFGSRESSSSQSFALYLSNSSNLPVFNFYGNILDIEGNFDNKILIFKGKINNSNFKCSIDGTVYYTLPITSPLYSGNMYLMTYNNNGSPVLPNTLGQFRLYSCKIYDNNTIVRDFVPCYRKADNVAGLYDLVNGVFYTNAGTGSFIVGGNV